MPVKNIVPKVSITLFVACLFSVKLFAQSVFEKQYQSFDYPVRSSVLEKRIFYLLDEIEHADKIKNELAKDPVLYNLYRQKITEWKHALSNCSNMQCLANALLYSDSENVAIQRELGKLYHQSKKIRSFVHNKIRASHFYELSNSLNDSLLLMHVWNEEAEGMNHIVNAYLLHKDLIYPTIDSAKYASGSPVYFDSVKLLLQKEIDRADKESLFYRPSETLVLSVLQLNGRNEAGRLEPLSDANGKAYKRAKHIDWSKYNYSAILVYGSGPGKETIRFSKINQMRCDSAVAVYKKGVAPFIIVSGGFVHPFMTHHCEAIEMRNYLVKECKIPADAVIIEPYARHTTTNIRNANRILIENKFPLNKPVLGVSSRSHIDYIVGQNFVRVFRRDIGVVPFTGMQRVSECEASYLPAMLSMQINSEEPLDP